MLGNLGQLAGLLKNAGQIKQNMEAMQERLAAARFTGEAGAGQVRATVDGRGDLVSIKLDPALVQAGDVEIIEDLTCAAVRDAVGRSRAAAQKELQEITGGLGLPGMGDLLGGPG
jgi:hypothetical protein